MSFFSFLAFSNASGPHGYQSTGLCACWSKYVLLDFASLFGFPFSFLSFSLPFGSSSPACGVEASEQPTNSTSAKRRGSIGGTPLRERRVGKGNDMSWRAEGVSPLFVFNSPREQGGLRPPLAGSYNHTRCRAARHFPG